MQFRPGSSRSSSTERRLPTTAPSPAIRRPTASRWSPRRATRRASRRSRSRSGMWRAASSRRSTRPSIRPRSPIPVDSSRSRPKRGRASGTTTFRSARSTGTIGFRSSHSRCARRSATWRMGAGPHRPGLRAESRSPRIPSRFTSTASSYPRRRPSPTWSVESGCSRASQASAEPARIPFRSPLGVARPASIRSPSR